MNDMTALPPDPQMQPMPSGYAQAAPSHSSYILQLTDHSERLDEFYLKLRGLVRDADGNVIKGKGLRARVNDDGASVLMGQLGSLMNDLTDLSSLDEFEIQNRLWANMTDILTLLTLHAQEWGVKGDGDRSAIATMFFNYSQSVLNRAHTDRLNDKRFFSRITQELNTRNEGPQEQGGFLSNFKIWGNK